MAKMALNFLSLSVCLFLLWQPPSPEAVGIIVAAPGLKTLGFLGGYSMERVSSMRIHMRVPL